MNKNIPESKTDADKIRCVKCGKMLARSLSQFHIEVKCSRCDTLNVVFESKAEQVIVMDPAGKILYMNKAMELTTGYMREQVIGKKPSEFWGRQMSKEFYQKMWHDLTVEKKTVNVTLANKNKKGEFYHVNLTISPILGGDGESMFFVGVETEVK